MQGRRKFDSTGLTRYHNTLWMKLRTDRTIYFDGLIHSAFTGRPTLSQLNDSDAQNHTINLHYRCLPCLSLLVGSVGFLIT